MTTHLRRRRERLGLTQGALGALAGLTQPQVSWCEGGHSPRLRAALDGALAREERRCGLPPLEPAEVPLISLGEAIDACRVLFDRFGTEPFSEAEAVDALRDHENAQALAFAERDAARPELPRERLARLLRS